LNRHRSIMTALLAAGTSLGIGGCASITTGTTHLIYVETKHKDAEVRGANCRLENSAGKIEIRTPGSGTVQRTASDLMIECEADGMPRGSAVARSRIRGALLGNIVFGGGIGAIIDAGTGAAYQYARKVVVQLGQATVVEPEDHQAELDRQAKEEKSGRSDSQ